jgi:endonuclease/exonuclease/phosphatase family metal-dependent hydrolase
MFIGTKLTKTVTRFTTLFVLILTITGCSSVTNIRPDAITPNFQSSLTVMTFNIRHGCGRESLGEATKVFFRTCAKKLDKIIAAIKSADPDVVGLQEVHRGQVGVIAEALDMNHVYSTHSSSGYGNYWGNAVLSKFKILESQNIGIGGSSNRDRGMVSATVLVNDKSIAFTSIHIDRWLYNYSSVKRILNYVDNHSMPIVLIGDFNMGPSDPRISLIKESGFIDSAWEAVKQGKLLGTWLGPHAERIDYVFVQSEYFDILESSLIAEEHHQASDHLAYYTVIKWK